MSQLTEYEKEREANIAKNRALLEELELKEAAASLGIPASKPKVQKGAKPVQSSRPKKRKAPEPLVPRRQSTRLTRQSRSDETPKERSKREAQEEEQRAKKAEERLEREEQERKAKRPRHHDLDLATLGDETSAEELATLTSTFESCTRSGPRRDELSMSSLDEEDKEGSRVAELRAQVENLKIVSRAKVTQDRVYSACYHPERTKDLILFGDKHGQLGIWDARAPQDEVRDEDGDIVPAGEEDGRVFRLQPHWPATSKSSISCVKLDPLDTHTVLTSSYDCTLRTLSFESGVSKEVFSLEDTLITSFEVNRHEIWISDALGGLTHTDVRERRSRARRYELSDAKIGCVSINPVRPEALLVSSNNKLLRLWDARKLTTLSSTSLPTPPPSSPLGPRGQSVRNSGPVEIGPEAIEKLRKSKQGKGALLAEWAHQKSVSSAYWDPTGRRIVSTSYDDTIRLWKVDWAKMTADADVKSFKPFSRMRHNCQTGKWLTILRSQWSQNPNVYPHFTVGNMNHSLNIVAATGEVIATLSDPTKITAVQAVTCSHPSIVARAASGNASGRCVLWAPLDVDD